jgi:hypothetical protein
MPMITDDARESATTSVVGKVSDSAAIVRRIIFEGISVARSISRINRQVMHTSEILFKEYFSRKH